MLMQYSTTVSNMYCLSIKLLNTAVSLSLFDCSTASPCFTMRQPCGSVCQFLSFCSTASPCFTMRQPRGSVSSCPSVPQLVHVLPRDNLVDLSVLVLLFHS